jgi:hypothetical protein
MSRIILLASALLFFAPGLALAQIVELEGRYWFTDVKAKAKVTSGSLEGTNVDFTEDLGLDAEGAPGVRLTFGLPFNSKIRLAYTYLHLQGDTTLDQTINFGGSTFTANTLVESELELHYGRLGWIWQPIAVPGVLKLGPILELKAAVLDATVDSRNTIPTVKESQELGLILPTIGAALDFTPHRMIHLFAEVSGLPGGSLGYIVDAEAGIRIVPVPFLTIAGGYRYFDLKIEYDNDSGQAKLYGPFVGVSARF